MNQVETVYSTFQGSKKCSNCRCWWSILYGWLLRYTFFASSCSRTPRTVPWRFFKQKPQVSTPNKKVEESKDLQKKEGIFRSKNGNLFKKNLELIYLKLNLKSGEKGCYSGGSTLLGALASHQCSPGLIPVWFHM